MSVSKTGYSPLNSTASFESSYPKDHERPSIGIQPTSPYLSMVEARPLVSRVHYDGDPSSGFQRAYWILGVSSFALGLGSFVTGLLACVVPSPPTAVFIAGGVFWGGFGTSTAALGATFCLDLAYCRPKWTREGEAEYDASLGALPIGSLLQGDLLRKYYTWFEDRHINSLNYVQISEIYEYDVSWVETQIHNKKFNLEQEKLWETILFVFPRMTPQIFLTYMNEPDFSGNYKSLFGLAHAIDTYLPKLVRDNPDVAAQIDALKRLQSEST